LHPTTLSLHDALPISPRQVDEDDVLRLHAVVVHTRRRDQTGFGAWFPCTQVAGGPPDQAGRNHPARKTDHLVPKLALGHANLLSDRKSTRLNSSHQII